LTGRPFYLEDENIIDIDRAKFAQYAEDYWVELEAGSYTIATAKVSAGIKIVDRWVEQGAVTPFLLPFLSHNSPAVRFAAAAHLIRYDAKEQAILVLRDLIMTCTNLIATSASAVLSINKC
jgi:hypothetical protein